MQEMEKSHPEVWVEFMKGNFCVTKGVAGFTSIGTAYSIEQENGELKVISGILGITQNEKSLHKYFLIATQIIKKTCCTGNNEKRTKHHALKGGKLYLVSQNAVKLSAVFLSMKTHLNLFMRIRYTTCSPSR